MCDSRRPENGADSKPLPKPEPKREPRWITWTKANNNVKEYGR